ncbi:hypothetical protein [Pseudomonas putida]|uniref:hypothetical protein n=1 Tax=Pseudomonas putida TaxID=303 RepID=UPI003905F1EF
MPTMKASDLRYPYKWSVTEGDDAQLISQDAQHLSRNEGYEMLLYLNSLTSDTGGDMAVSSRQVVEWMLKEHYPATASNARSVTDWVFANWNRLVDSYPG